LDKRIKKDFWARLLFYINTFSWILLVFILLVFHQAQPEFESFFDRFYQLSLRTHWDSQFLFYLFYLVVFGIFMSTAGIILAFFRGRRKNDSKKAIILTGAISFVMLCVIFFLF
jgi:hypothetical protein